MSHCEQVDGIQKPDKETEGYVFNHMMLRIKDPKRSLDFYSKVMGMRMVKKIRFSINEILFIFFRKSYR